MKLGLLRFYFLVMIWPFWLGAVDMQNVVMLTKAIAVCDELVDQKYEMQVIKVIDKYICLCGALERITGPLSFTGIRLLSFTHPCIIRCYNQIVQSGRVGSLTSLWQAYKIGVVSNDRQKFLYELCYLIIVVFEQFFVKIATDFTGQSPQSLHDLFDKIELSMPLEDLINILEQCYQELSHLMEHAEHQQQIERRATIKRLLLVTTVALVVINRLYRLWYNRQQSASAGRPEVFVPTTVVQRL